MYPFGLNHSYLNGPYYRIRRVMAKYGYRWDGSKNYWQEAYHLRREKFLKK